MTKTEKKVDWGKSRIIADIIDSRYGECLANVVRAFLDYPDSLPEDAVHVEGIYVYGGQYMPHTWIETKETIIDLSLVQDTSSERNYVQYYPILTRDIREITLMYGGKPRHPGVIFRMEEITYDDPRVIRLLDKTDTPPELRRIY